MKVKDIISLALKQLGIVGIGEEVPGDVLDDVLISFKVMLDSWQRENLLQYKRKVYTLPANKNPVCIGPYADCDVMASTGINILKVYIPQPYQEIEKWDYLGNVTSSQAGLPTKYVVVNEGDKIYLYFDRTPQVSVNIEVAYMVSEQVLTLPDGAIYTTDSPVFEESVIFSAPQIDKGDFLMLPNGDMLVTFYDDYPHVYVYKYDHTEETWTQKFSIISAKYPRLVRDTVSGRLTLIIYGGNTYISDDEGENWVAGTAINAPYYLGHGIMINGVGYLPGWSTAGYLQVVKWDENGSSLINLASGNFKGAVVYSREDENKLAVVFNDGGTMKYIFTNDGFTTWSNPEAFDYNVAMALDGVKSGDVVFYLFNHAVYSSDYFDTPFVVGYGMPGQPPAVVREITPVKYRIPNGIDYKDNMIYFTYIDKSVSPQELKLVRTNIAWINAGAEDVKIKGVWDLQPEDDLELPAGWVQALADNLAVEIAPAFGIQISQGLLYKAKMNKVKIKQQEGFTPPIVRSDFR